MNSNLPLQRPPATFRLPRIRPKLRFTPWAWAKLLFLRDFGPTEVGGFGITEPSDSALVTDICLLPQHCTSVTVAFEDAAVADFFDRQVDQGRLPVQFARIWVHTHPGDSAAPSLTDERTFSRVFGECDWAVMFIVARGGARYARARFNTGPGGELRLPVKVDYQTPFAATNHDAWEQEYKTCVRQDVEIVPLRPDDATLKLPTDLYSDPGRSDRDILDGFDPCLFEENMYV